MRKSIEIELNNSLERLEALKEITVERPIKTPLYGSFVIKYKEHTLLEIEGNYKECVNIISLATTILENLFKKGVN